MIAVGSLAQSASQPPTEATVMNRKDTADPLGTAENQMAKTSRDRVSSAGKKKEAAARQRPDVAIEDEPVIRLSLDHGLFGQFEFYSCNSISLIITVIENIKK